MLLSLDLLPALEVCRVFTTDVFALALVCEVDSGDLDFNADFLLLERF